MARIAWLQFWLACLLAASALFVECTSAGRRAGRTGYRSSIGAYKARDHSGEIVFMGSSLVGCGIVPGAVEEGLRARGIDAEAYCLFFGAGLPPTYRDALHRLILADGRPRLLVLGLSPRDMNANSPRLDRYAQNMGSVTQVLRLVKRAPWRRHTLLWPLLSRPPAACLQLVVPDRIMRAAGKKATVKTELARDGSRWWYDAGNSAEVRERNAKLAKKLTEQRYQERLDVSRELLDDFAVGDFEAELVGVIEDAREAGIEVAVCLFDYSERAERDLDGGWMRETEALVEDLCLRRRLPLWRKREAYPEGNEWRRYFDGVDHLGPDAGAEFSRKLGAGPVADLLLAEGE